MNSIKCVLVLQCLFYSVAFAQSSELAPANLETMGTSTVEETLTELKKDPDRVFATHDGWLVAEKRIEGGSELWSFVPEGHEAYPSAIQRLITDGEEGLQIDMSIQCDATLQACEDLRTLFRVMNENLIGVSKNAPPVR